MSATKIDYFFSNKTIRASVASTALPQRRMESPTGSEPSNVSVKRAVVNDPAIIINHVSTCVILLAFGIANLVVSQSYPHCGLYGQLSLSTWETVCGILQVVASFVGILLSFSLCMEDNVTLFSASCGAKTSVVYFTIAHLMNVILAIVGSVSISQSWDVCYTLSEPVGTMAMATVAVAFALIPLYLMVFIFSRCW